MVAEIYKGNRDMMVFSGFQQLLYRKFLQERRWRVDEIAQQLNVGRSTMYAWIDGERQFPVDLVGMLATITGDTDFLDFVLIGTGYTLAPLPEPTVDVRRVEAETLDVAREVGNVVASVQGALKDGRVDRREAEQIRQAVRTLQREAEEVASACNGTNAGQALKVVK